MRPGRNLARVLSLAVFVVLTGLAHGQWGQPPLVTTSAFRPWCDAYVQSVVNSCPLERQTIIYVSPSGSDTTGNGSISRPYQTIAKANSVLAESSGNIAVLFARGGVFRSSVGLKVTVPSVNVGAYTPPGVTPDAPKPVLTCFQPALPSNAWTETNVAGVFQATVAGTVSWIKIVSDSNTVLQQEGSEAAVSSTPGSWCQSGTQIFVHLLGGESPGAGTKQFEYVLRNTAEGVLVSDVADVRLDSLEIEGFGAGAPNDYTYNGYGIESDQSGTHRLVVTNCQVTYNGRHSICKVTPSSGGSLVVVGCRIGWMANDNLPIVSEAAQGNQELVVAHNVIIGGQLPASVNVFAGTTGGTTDAHTGGPNTPVGLMLSVGNVVQVGQFEAMGPDTIADAPAFADLANCRSFVVDEICDARMPTAYDSAQTTPSGGVCPQMGSPNTVYVGCSLTARMLWLNGHTCQILENSSGIWLNSDILFDFSCVPTNSTGASYAVQFGSHLGASFYNCNLEFRVAGGTTRCGFDQSFLESVIPVAPAQGFLVNSLITCDDLGGGQFQPAWNNDGIHMMNNAYPENSLLLGLAGMNGDPYGAVSPIFPTFLQGQLVGSPSTPQGVLGYTLQYDKIYNPRIAGSARGAYEAPQGLGG